MTWAAFWFGAFCALLFVHALHFRRVRWAKSRCEREMREAVDKNYNYLGCYEEGRHDAAAAVLFALEGGKLS